MALVSMRSLMKHALEGRYAVGYFESWNMESTLAVIDAAEEAESPVIIGFSGVFLGNDERRIEENIYHYGSLGVAIAENAKVPVALLLNEADKEAILINGLKAGFNAIMHQDAKCTLQEEIDMNRYLVRTAHHFGADVEAEVGALPTADRNRNTIGAGEPTDPDKAAYFVETTQIDALAIAVGNVHLLEGRKSNLDLALIRRIRSKVSVPLVLHGGTGMSAEGMREAITSGICKINVGTVLKRVFIDALREGLTEDGIDAIDLHEIMGKGGKYDILSRARYAMARQVLSFMEIFGSEGKAKEWGAKNCHMGDS